MATFVANFIAGVSTGDAISAAQSAAAWAIQQGAGHESMPYAGDDAMSLVLGPEIGHSRMLLRSESAAWQPPGDSGIFGFLPAGQGRATTSVPFRARRFDKRASRQQHAGMAKTTIVAITDDLDGSEGAETVAFSFDGQNYEIDLSPKNRDKLNKTLQPFIDSGRRVGRQSGTRAVRTRASRNDSSAVRTWAAEQGLKVSERGRIPASVVAQYEAAH